MTINSFQITPAEINIENLTNIDCKSSSNEKQVRSL